MNKFVVVAITLVASVVFAGSYYFYTRVNASESASTAQTAPLPQQQSPVRPDHGDFGKRFEPKPPGGGASSNR